MTNNVKRTPKKMRKNMVGGSLGVSQDANYRLNSLQENEFVPYTSSILSIGKKYDDRKKREKDELREKQEQVAKQRREMMREQYQLEEALLDQERAAAEGAQRRKEQDYVMSQTVKKTKKDLRARTFITDPIPEDFVKPLEEQGIMNEKLRKEYDLLLNKQVALDQDYTAKVKSIQDLKLPPSKEKERMEELEDKHNDSKKGMMDTLYRKKKELLNSLSKEKALTIKKERARETGFTADRMQSLHNEAQMGAAKLAREGNDTISPELLDAATDLATAEAAAASSDLSGDQGRDEAQQLAIVRQRYHNQVKKAPLPDQRDQGELRELILRQQQLADDLKKDAMELARRKAEFRRESEKKEKELKRQLDQEKQRLSEQPRMIRDIDSEMRQMEKEAHARAQGALVNDPSDHGEREKVAREIQAANDKIKRLMMENERLSNDRKRADHQRRLDIAREEADRLNFEDQWLRAQDIPRSPPPSPPQSPEPYPRTPQLEHRLRQDKKPRIRLEQQLDTLLLQDFGDFEDFEEPIPEDEGDYSLALAPLESPPLTQKKRDLIAEQNVIRIQNEIESLKRRKEEAELQKQYDTTRRLIEEQEEMNRQLKEEQRRVDEERERGVIPFDRRQVLVNAGQDNVEMMIAELQSSPGDSAEKTRKMQEYLNLQEELNQLKEKNRRQAQRNQQMVQRNDYGSPAPLDPPTLSPLPQDKRDLLAEQNVIRIQNEIASLKRRKEEAELQNQQAILRELIEEQEEMDRQLKEEQRRVDEERERGVIPFDRRQVLVNAGQDNVEMMIAELQSSPGDSAEKTRKMQEYLNLQEELNQLKEKNRRQAQRNQQMVQRNDYGSPAPLDPPTLSPLPQDKRDLLAEQNVIRIQNEIASLKRRKEEAELQNQQAILRELIEEQEEMDRQLKEEQRRVEREKQQQLALQPQRRQNLLTSAIINAERERLHAQSRLKDDIIAGTSSGPNMKRLEESKLELQRLKQLKEKLRLESERNLQDRPPSQPMRPDDLNLIEDQAIVRLQDELSSLKAEQELAEKLNQIETMNALIKEQQEKKRQLEEEQRNLDRYRDSEEQIPPHHQQRLIQDAIVNIAKKNTKVELDQGDGGYSEEQMRDFEENKRLLKKLQEIQEELYKQNQPDSGSPLLIEDLRRQRTPGRRGSESKHKQLARQFDKKAEEDRQREAEERMADKNHGREIQHLKEQAARGDESAQGKLKSLDKGGDARKNAVDRNKLRRTKDTIKEEKKKNDAEEQLRLAEEEHAKEQAAARAAALREEEKRQRIADEKAAKEEKEKLAAEEAAREKQREEERARKEKQRRDELQLIENNLNKKYNNLIKNKDCRDIFMKIFKNACDYMQESSKGEPNAVSTHQRIINDAKNSINSIKSSNADIFINALECISLMFKKKGGFESKSKPGDIYSNIKNSEFGEFFNYLKYKKYKIYTDDCMLNGKEQKIPS